MTTPDDLDARFGPFRRACEYQGSAMDLRIRAARDPEPDVSAYAGGEGKGCTLGAIITGLFGLCCVVGIVALVAWAAGVFK